MLNTCIINGSNLFQFLKKSSNYETVEVMLHPALPNKDQSDYFETLDSRFVEFLKDPHRKSEFDLCFDENFEKHEITK